eukprot:tig00000042_g15667.t1
METLPLALQSHVVSFLGAPDAARLAGASRGMDRVVDGSDAYWAEQLARRGIVVPSSLPTGAAREIFTLTANSTCASCRRGADGTKCPLAGCVACARCREPVGALTAAELADLPPSAARGLARFPHRPGRTTLAVAMAERDRRALRPAPPRAESSKELAGRFGLSLKWFGIPGGIPVVGYDGANLEERYDPAFARRWAADRRGPDPEGAAQRMREGRARRKQVLLHRLEEEKRMLEERRDRIVERLTAVAERYDPPLQITADVELDHRNRLYVICGKVARANTTGWQLDTLYPRGDELESEDTYNAFPGVRETTFPAFFRLFDEQKPNAHREYRLGRLAAALGAVDVVIARPEPTPATPLYLYLYAGVKARFEEALEELRGILASRGKRQ